MQAVEFTFFRRGLSAYSLDSCSIIFFAGKDAGLGRPGPDRGGATVTTDPHGQVGH